LYLYTRHQQLLKWRQQIIRTNGPAAVNATQSPNTAKYDVTGTPNETLSLPSVDLSSATTGTGLATMTINNLNRFNTADADAITSTLSSTGTDSFAVEEL
jgi:hypothetical protein